MSFSLEYHRLVAHAAGVGEVGFDIPDAHFRHPPDNPRPYLISSVEALSACLSCSPGALKPSA